MDKKRTGTREAAWEWGEREGTAAETAAATNGWYDGHPPTLLAKGWWGAYKFSIPFSFFGDRVACFPLFSFL